MSADRTVGDESGARAAAGQAATPVDPVSVGLPGAADPPAVAASREHWDAEGVRRLRGYLGASQAGLAERLGTRQQTVSEWETGASRPRRMSRRLLRLVAEESGYYAVTPDPFTDRPAGGTAP